MRPARLVAVFCVAFLLAPSARAETAGQVLAVVGDALALRAGQIVRLFPGASVEPGDQIHTGPASGIQIRFTDWGLVSLRPRSDFVVDEYIYEQRQGGRERAYFSLLKGGVSSITGLIGHRDHANYRMRAPIATIGIRGTHFSLLMCKGDCVNADGSPGEDGLYGEVSEGRIAVSPYGGRTFEREFGAGERFRLVDENSIPSPLFTVPPFFPNPLEAQARSGGPAAPPLASVGGVVSGVGSGTSNPNPVAGVTGSLPATLTSTLPVAGALTAPLANGVVRSATGTLASTVNGLTPVTGVIVSTLPAAGTLVSPLENGVVLPAAGLAGSLVNSALSMPGAVVPLAGSALNAVPVVVAPVLSTVGAVVNTVPPINVPPVTIPPVTVPVVPPVTTPVVPPITTPVVPPVTTPVVPPIATPVVPPVTTPIVPVTTPVVPVTVPVLPPVTVPTLPPVIVSTPPPVTTPTLPTLPLGAISPLRR
jgi:FecR-like protein